MDDRSKYENRLFKYYSRIITILSMLKSKFPPKNPTMQHGKQGVTSYDLRLIIITESRLQENTRGKTANDKFIHEMIYMLFLSWTCTKTLLSGENKIDLIYLKMSLRQAATKRVALQLHVSLHLA